MQNTFKKAERLYRQKVISTLFAEGKTVVKYPFRALILDAAKSSWPPCETMFSVSKKRFKRANVRNLLKRRMREAYRTQKATFYAQLAEFDTNLAMAIIYIPKEELDFQTINKGMTKLLAKIAVELKPTNSNAPSNEVKNKDC
jgi:ribonuclease P protein component